MVAGGRSLVEGPQNNQVKLYNPEAGEWTRGKPMPQPRAFQTATLLDDWACSQPNPPGYCGKILIAGGAESASQQLTPLTNALLYDFTMDTWLPGGVNAAPHSGGHTATVMAGPSCQGASRPNYCGRVLITGGFPGTKIVELYDPNLNAWTVETPMNTARADHAASALKDGSVLVSGGAINFDANAGDGQPNLSSPVLDSAELFDPSINSGLGSWVSAGTMTQKRRYHASQTLNDGSVLVVGGTDNFEFPHESGVVNTSEIYRPLSSDLLLVAKGDLDTTEVGKDISYRIDIKNLGPDTAAGVNLVDQLPAGVVFRSATLGPGQAGSCTPGLGSVQCTLGDLAGGASASVSIVVVPAQVSAQPVTLVNTASVSTVTQDPNLANNTSVVQTLLNPLLKFGGPVQPGPPQVTGLSENCGPAAGGTAVRVLGSGFTGAAIVKFGDAVAPSFVVRSNGEISATSPAHADGAVNVTVSGPAGTSGPSPANAFTYPCPPPAPKPPAEGGFSGAGSPQAAQKTPLVAPPGGTGFSPSPVNAPVLGQAPGLSPGPAGGPAAGTSFNPGSALAPAPGQIGQPGSASVTVGAVDAVQEDSQPALQIHQFVGRNQSPIALTLLPLAGMALVGCAIPIAGRRRRLESAIQAAPARA